MQADILIHFVGAGPGAADLITLRGMHLLEKAAVVIYAGSLVNPALLSYAPQAEIFDSSRMTLDETIEVMQKTVAQGKELVRLHTGEPSLYGAVKEQMRRLDALNIAYDSCPGVSACFGAAASMNLEYTLPDVSQTLIITREAGTTGVPEKERIESLAAHKASMAIYLSTSLLEKLSTDLISGGYPANTPAAIVYKATWPEERKVLCTIETLQQAAAENGITKTAVILVGDFLSENNFTDSRLYAPDFSTEFRKGTK